MRKPTALFGDEFAAYVTTHGNPVALHLESRTETQISHAQLDALADIALEFAEDHDGMRQTLDEAIADIMMPLGLVVVDEWSGTYRNPADIAADAKADAEFAAWAQSEAAIHNRDVL